MCIRLTQLTDLPDLMAIFHEAQRTIAALGIDQWQNGYPSETVIRRDILLGQSYVVEQNGVICGTFVLVDWEPTYEKIFEGQWETEDYVAIHRVAIPVAYRGTGVSGAILDYAASYAKKRNLNALRVDTHKGNIPMRTMLQKQGFTACGVIYLSDGAHRVAYEKRVGAIA